MPADTEGRMRLAFIYGNRSIMVDVRDAHSSIGVSFYFSFVGLFRGSAQMKLPQWASNNSEFAGCVAGARSHLPIVFDKDRKTTSRVARAGERPLRRDAPTHEELCCEKRPSAERTRRCGERGGFRYPGCFRAGIFLARVHASSWLVQPGKEAYVVDGCRTKA